ncbi:MAG: hypothetical protein C5S49_05190 [Candidatus Methanogaster sp.]|nr:MAG: hypothetical protein C5S49_05190 [ANME-2 cluster archaeon]
MKKGFKIFTLFALIIISSAKSHSDTVVKEAINLSIHNTIKYEAAIMNWDQYVSLARSGKVPAKLVCNEFVSLVLARACTFSSDEVSNISTTITGLSGFLNMTKSSKAEDLKPGDILFLVYDSYNCHDAPSRQTLRDGVGDHVGVVVQVSDFGSGVGGVFLAESGSKIRSCLCVLQEELVPPGNWKQQKGGRINFYPYYYLKRFMVGYARPSETYCNMSEGRDCLPLMQPTPLTLKAE